MKKFLVLTISALIIAGCGAGSGSEEIFDQEEQVDDVVASDCILGDLYSLPELSFDLCSVEEVSIGSTDNNLTPINYDNMVPASVVEGDYISSRLTVSYDELVESLEGGFFTGVESNSDDTLSLNYVDMAGFNVLKVEYTGQFNGFRDYFALVEDDLLIFDDNFEAVSVLSGVRLR